MSLKDDEIQRLLFEIQGYNIRQEQELFKHIAILSSTIVGVFLINGNFNLSTLAKYGLLGFVLVIILSVVLIFLILRIERHRAFLAMKMVEKIKVIRMEDTKKVLRKVFDDNFLKFIQVSWNTKDLLGAAAVTAPIAFQIVDLFTKPNEKIVAEKEKFRKGKILNLTIQIVAYITLGLFVASLVMIIVAIIQ